MSDFYNGYDEIREHKQKLMDRIYDWWDSLTEKEQLNIMLDWCPTEVDDLGNLPNNEQIAIWEKENKMTEEDIQGRKDRAIDMIIEEKRLGVME